MPSTSKVVSGLVEFQEPGHGVSLVSCSLFPVRQKHTYTHTSNSAGSCVIHWSEGLIQIFLGCSVLITAGHRGYRSEGLQGLTLWARQTLLRQFSQHAMDGAITGGSWEHCRGAEEKPLTQLLGSAGCLFGENFQSVSPGVYSISRVY